MISILILTKNEAGNLPGCLASVRWCDDVVVLDSFSTDQTVALAQAGGARVFQRAFDDFAGQRNYALDHIPFKHPWIFHLDADEHFTPALRAECERVIHEDRCSGFLVPSKLIYMGRWLKHSGMYPTYQMRLLKLGEVRFVQHGHGQRETDARRGVGKLAEPYFHYNFSKGLADWYARHERYAAAEAAANFTLRSAGRSTAHGLFSTDATVRRRALKDFSARLPFRPALRFLYMYFLRLGFLDGRAGWEYCRMLSRYERMIVTKLRDLQRQSPQPAGSRGAI